ncbi:unnamed protein product [Closterium sp. NIES-65]|nr:unnamed protein product [Closterium sp. NIES-65]
MCLDRTALAFTCPSLPPHPLPCRAGTHEWVGCGSWQAAGSAVVLKPSLASSAQVFTIAYSSAFPRSPPPISPVLSLEPLMGALAAVLSLEPLVGALAAGNAVVLKPSEHSPASAHLLSRLLPLYLDSQAVQAGAIPRRCYPMQVLSHAGAIPRRCYPTQVLSQVVEGGPETGKALLGRRWDKIFFTGGTALGRIVMEAASKHLTPVTLELGGKNPLFIDESADLEVCAADLEVCAADLEVCAADLEVCAADLEISAKRIVSGKCTNAGQVCLVPDYILASKDVAARLLPHLKAAIEQFYGTNPALCPDLARIINASHVLRLQKLLQHPATASCVVHGGQSDVESRYFAPTLLLNVPWDAPIMQSEVFGPILAIQTVRPLILAIQTVRPLILAIQTVSGIDEAIDIINVRPKLLVVSGIDEAIDIINVRPKLLVVSGIDEAIDIINARPKPLVVMVFSSREDTRQRFLKETSSGAVVANELILQVCSGAVVANKLILQVRLREGKGRRREEDRERRPEGAVQRERQGEAREWGCHPLLMLTTESPLLLTPPPISTFFPPQSLPLSVPYLSLLSTPGQAGNLELPFGGVGDSGMGRYKGRWSMDCFSHCKAAYTKPLSRDLAARFPPSTRRGEMIVKAVIKGAYWTLLLLLLGLKKH